MDELESPPPSPRASRDAGLDQMLQGLAALKAQVHQMQASIDALVESSSARLTAMEVETRGTRDLVRERLVFGQAAGAGKAEKTPESIVWKAIREVAGGTDRLTFNLKVLHRQLTNVATFRSAETVRLVLVALEELGHIAPVEGAADAWRANPEALLKGRL